MSSQIIIIGLGEVGRPLLEIIHEKQPALGVDIDPVAAPATCDIMHVCIPYSPARFVREVLRYIEKYRPDLTIINSTVGVGTTREIAERSGAAVVHSPVRGKHAKMKADMRHYTKFIGALDESAGRKAAEHFQAVGLRTRRLGSPEATELAKLTETTYFGLMIAWAQEVERYSKATGARYDEVIAFYEEISFFPPVKYFPGIIGGHCVLPNIKILKDHFDSGLLDAIERSNELKRSGLGIESWHNTEPAAALATR
jgi:UDP-N-acetyl-D-mannosaminuronate dehydrogenase